MLIRDAFKVGLADATQLMLRLNDNDIKRSHPTIYVLLDSKPSKVFGFFSSIFQQKFECYCLCEMQCKGDTGDFEALWCDMHTHHGTGHVLQASRAERQGLLQRQGGVCDAIRQGHEDCAQMHPHCTADWDHRSTVRRHAHHMT